MLKGILKNKFLFFAWCSFCGSIFLLASILLLASVTFRGRLLASALLLMALGVFILLSGLGRDWKKSVTLAGGIGLGLGFACWFRAWGLAPSGRPISGSAFSQHYLDGWHFRRSALSNIIPEVDQFRYCGFFLGSIDPALPSYFSII